MTEGNGEVRELPKGWALVQFQDIVQSFKRGPFGSAIKKEFFVPEGYKVYEQQNAIYDDPNRGRYFISEEKYNELEGFQVEPKDFIVSCSGTIGKITRLPEDAKPGIINQALLRIRLEESLFNPKLFLFLFRAGFFQKLVQVETRGSAMKNIAGVKDLKTISLKLPPLAEQERIIEKIEELFSDIDYGIESLKTAQKQLKVYRQAVLKWAFEGKLTEEWRKQHSSTLKTGEALLAQIKAERENRYQQQLAEWEEKVREWEAIGKVGKKPAKPSKSKELQPLTKTDISELSPFPNAWCLEKLGNFSELVGGVTKGRDFKGQTTISLPYLRVANVQDGYLDLSVTKYIDVLPSELDKYRLLAGDILYTEGGDKDKLGRGTVWKEEIKDCIHQNHVFRARLLSSEVLSSFIAYYSQTQVAKDYFFKRAKQTVNLASINMTIL